MKKLYAIIILSLGILLSSCQKFEVAPLDNEVNAEITMENLKVDQHFNWKTHNDVNLKLTGNTDNKVVEVRSSNGTVYQKAYLQNGEAFDMKVTIPTYETSVSLAYNNEVVPVDISSGNVEYTFN